MRSLRQFLCCLALYCGAGPVLAQLLPLPELPRTPSVPIAAPALAPTLDERLDRSLRDVRELAIRDLLRRHPDQLERDPDGAPVVRGELLALDLDEAGRQRVQAAGLHVLETREWPELGLSLSRLQASPRRRTRAVLRELRRQDPHGQYDYNHLYLDAGDGQEATSQALPVSRPFASGLRLGLVDSGVDRAHPALSAVRVHVHGCEGRALPHRHGTAVASLLVGDAAVGTAVRGELFAADIYCGQATGGNAVALVDALAWMRREQVGVINISLVGPRNALMERAVAAMIGRGHVLVAAVGNDGPAAPPLFPASSPGVLGVTAIDARGRVLPEAARGAQVDVAAPGAGMLAAGLGSDWWAVRGTSFAAPLVARLLGAVVRQPQADAMRTAENHLARVAADAGTRGPDRSYGLGIVARELPARRLERR